MQKLLLAVDRLSTWFGKACAWTVVGLTLLITWEVFSRYVLNKPHAWVLDAQIMLYGVLFMCAGAYTLAKSGHVRGDVLYGFFQPAHPGRLWTWPSTSCFSCPASWP